MEERKTIADAVTEALAADPEIAVLQAVVLEKKAELKDAEVALARRLDAAMRGTTPGS